MLAGVGPTLRLIAAAGAAYLVGSLPVARAVARRAGVDDLRNVGDRNPGYWNAREVLGPPAARPIFVGDLAKGIVAASIGRLVDDRWWVPYATGGAAMAGHAFPVFDGFRGGRSVLAFVGAASVYSPRSALAGWATLGSALVASAGAQRDVRAARLDVAIRVAVASFPVWQLVVDGARRTAATGVLMTFVGWRFVTARIQWADQGPVFDGRDVDRAR